ncbi:hypothetical protein TREES_T100000610 [Tupaia chinensis]|uniref:Uncharacterized protein n=1 Tax=Tupaia chinensis TaxID=246437 RepID=L9KUB0_TUPCH|nr:hypothetical protein TREES_T100000610 [Tupaia chinensis]
MREENGRNRIERLAAEELNSSSVAKRKPETDVKAVDSKGSEIGKVEPSDHHGALGKSGQTVGRSCLRVSICVHLLLFTLATGAFLLN